MKEGEARMEGFLYNSVDVQNSYENIVCLMNHLVPKNS
jgi:hypothetical protein